MYDLVPRTFSVVRTGSRTRTTIPRPSGYQISSNCFEITEWQSSTGSVEGLRAASPFSSVADRGRGNGGGVFTTPFPTVPTSVVRAVRGWLVDGSGLVFECFKRGNLVLLHPDGFRFVSRTVNFKLHRGMDLVLDLFLLSQSIFCVQSLTPEMVVVCFYFVSGVPRDLTNSNRRSLCCRSSGRCAPDRWCWRSHN